MRKWGNIKYEGLFEHKGESNGEIGDLFDLGREET